MPLRLPAVFTVVLPLLVASVPPQTGKDSPAAREFAKGAALYYTPAKADLSSFHCDLAIDFKQILGDSAATDKEGLAFLEGLKVSIDDDLHTTATLHWPDDATIPEAQRPGVSMMREGFGKSIGGILQIWNNFMTGELVSVSDDDTRVEKKGEGYHLIAQQGDNLAEEDYGPQYRLERFHTHAGGADVEIKPTFADSPDGRLMSHMKMTVQPGAAQPAIVIDSDFTYAMVDHFRLLSKIVITVPGSPVISANLNNCTVKRAAPPAPTK